MSGERRATSDRRAHIVGIHTACLVPAFKHLRQYITALSARTDTAKRSNKPATHSDAAKQSNEPATAVLPKSRGSYVPAHARVQFGNAVVSAGSGEH